MKEGKHSRWAHGTLKHSLSPELLEFLSVTFAKTLHYGKGSPLLCVLSHGTSFHPRVLHPLQLSWERGRDRFCANRETKECFTPFPKILPLSCYLSGWTHLMPFIGSRRTEKAHMRLHKASSQNTSNQNKFKETKGHNTSSQSRIIWAHF